MYCIKSHIYFQVSPSTSEIFNKNLKIGRFYPGLPYNLKPLGLLKFQCHFWVSRTIFFFIRCIIYFSKSCWLFWDREQNMLIFGRKCSAPLRSKFRQAVLMFRVIGRVLSIFYLTPCFGSSILEVLPQIQTKDTRPYTALCSSIISHELQLGVFRTGIYRLHTCF